jgi:MoxR-like ATPase
MSDALKRRCIHLYIDYPERDLELEIVKLKIPKIKNRLANQLIDAIGNIRDLDLKKKPCISETLDWAQSLITLQVEDISPEVVSDTLNVICKYRADVEQVKEKMDKIIEMPKKRNA